MPVPQPSDGFEWTQAPWGAVLRCRPLQPFAQHFFTTSSLELRDDPGEWNQVAAFAGVTVGRLQLLTQVHGRTIAVVPAGVANTDRPEADAAVSNEPSAALVVRVADCAPILIADKRLRVTAAVHAGWRSTMERIASAAVMALAEAFGSRPRDLIVAIGPSLGVCCGEMGDEVVDAFREAGHDESSIERWFVREAGRRPHFDLWRANRDQLEGAGVRPAAIHVSGLCTRSHPGVFHSFRAAGLAVGRMAAVIRANR